MKDPKQLETVISGATYEAPIYRIVDGKPTQVGSQQIVFCSSRIDQQGFFVDSLLVACGKTLQDNFAEEVPDENITKAIAAIKTALAEIKEYNTKTKQ